MAEKKTAFYCQLDYEHVPYPSPVGAKNGNIANNGCGVCAASMVAENMLGIAFPPVRAQSSPRPAARAKATAQICISMRLRLQGMLACRCAIPKMGRKRCAFCRKGAA